MKRLLFIISALTFSAPAFAYLDPGSGSAIISAIIGFFVAAGMVIKTYWYKIKSIFVKSDKSEENSEENPTNNKN